MASQWGGLLQEGSRAHLPRWFYISPAQANNVKKLKGRPDYRLRVGDFRVIFSETATTITIHAVGPRGGVYD